jgi:predicted dehydrogenase
LGCGSIGRRHARNLAALGHTDLILHDPSREALESAPLPEGARRAATLDEVWRQEPRAVLVTAPTHLHVPLAREAARRGCDLFIEKPLSHGWDGVEELRAESRARGLITMVGCNMRFHPGPARIRELLRDGAVGQPVAARIFTGSYLPDWRPGTDYRKSYSASFERGGGVLLDCIHEIDLALWYFGPARLAAAVSVPASTIGLDVEGTAELLLRHESGTLTSVHLNFVQRDYSRGCRVVGSEGSLSWDFGDGRVLWTTPGATREFRAPEGWELDAMYRDELRDFVHAVQHRTRAANDLDESLAALRIALEARAAATEPAARVGR